jgi:hypothetical protein
VVVRGLELLQPREKSRFAGRTRCRARRQS